MTQLSTAAPTPVVIGPDKKGWWWGTGRRKTSVASVRLRPGTGSIVVNGKPFDVFFTEERDRKDLLTILDRTNLGGRLDIQGSCKGGGFTGQAGAMILGIGRALKDYDASLEPILRENGYLTRDDRKVERKKYGQAGARRRFQFSKR